MEKKNNNIGLKIFVGLVIIFLCLYSISVNGYSERINLEKTLITEKEIDRFENDVQNSNYIDLKDYNKNRTIDYSNKASRMGEKISNIIEITANKSIKYVKKIFSYFFE